MSAKYSRLILGSTVIPHPEDPNGGTGEQTRQKLLTYRVDQLEKAFEKAVGEIRDAIKSIDKSLQVLAVADIQLEKAWGEKAWGEIEALEKRVVTVELELPTMKLVRTWVITLVVGVLGSVGTAVVALVLR